MGKKKSIKRRERRMRERADLVDRPLGFGPDILDYYNLHQGNAFIENNLEYGNVLSMQSAQQSSFLKMMQIIDAMQEVSHNNPEMWKDVGMIKTGRLSGFNLKPIADFPAIVNYNDSEGNDQIFAQALIIGNMQSSISINIRQGEYDSAKKKLPALKEKMDLLLNQNPQIFISSATQRSVYYTYEGCLDYVSNNIEKAKRDFLYGLIYECIYISQWIDTNNLDERVKWSIDNMGNLSNYNTIATENNRINNPFEIVHFHYIANIFVKYLLHLASHNVLSQRAVWAYGQHIIMMLDISVKLNELNQDFLDEKDSLNKCSSKYSPMQEKDWDVVLPALKSLEANIKGFDTVYELAEHVCGQKGVMKP